LNFPGLRQRNCRSDCDRDSGGVHNVAEAGAAVEQAAPIQFQPGVAGSRFLTP